MDRVLEAASKGFIPADEEDANPAHVCGSLCFVEGKARGYLLFVAIMETPFTQVGCYVALFLQKGTLPALADTKASCVLYA